MPGTHTVRPLRIAVIDDSQTFRYTLCKLLAKFPTIEIVGEAADGNSAIEMALHLVPDVITMDVKMPRLNGIEATRRIKRALPDVHVVGVSSQEDSATKEAMTIAGCAAFVTKDCAHTLPEVLTKVTGRPIVKNGFDFPKT
jgi:DNA-binding NarL/FixJ family response regulator